MKKREAAFTTKFQKWATRHIPPPAAFEIKVVQGNSVPFNAVQPHQIAWLRAAESKILGTCYKIPDAGAGSKPFDVVMIGRMCAFVVVQFASCFAVIPVFDWCQTERMIERKSLTAEHAKRIATYYDDPL